MADDILAETARIIRAELEGVVAKDLPPLHDQLPRVLCNLGVEGLLAEVMIAPRMLERPRP